MKATRIIAGVGPLLFFAIATIEGFLRADYHPIAQPISALALGERGWIQGINFFILAVSLLAMAGVLRGELRGRLISRAVPALLVIMSVAVALAGVFPMDAPGAAPTRAGEIHMAAGFLVFPVIPFVILLGSQRWRAYSVATALFCLASIVFFLIFVGPPGFPRPLPHLVGLVQRLELFPFLAWLAAMATEARVIESQYNYSKI